MKGERKEDAEKHSKDSELIPAAKAIFIIGIALLAFSFYKSYPLQVSSMNDFLFRHIHPTYFIGLSLANAGLFIMLLNTKNRAWKLAGVVGFMLLFYSIFFFFPMIPGSDSHYFRGLTAQFTFAEEVNYHASAYFQWPLMFMMGRIISQLTGITNIHLISLIIFLISAFILCSSLYLIFERINPDLAFVAVVLYFYSIFYFVNIQYAAQTLALAILFFTIYLTLKKRSIRRNIIIITAYTALLFTHPFFAVFFILYVAFILAAPYVRRIRILDFFKAQGNQPADVSIMLLLLLIVGYAGYTAFFATDFLSVAGNMISDKIDEKGDANWNIMNKYVDLALHRREAYSYLEIDKENQIDFSINEEGGGEEAGRDAAEMASSIAREKESALKFDRYAQVISRTAIQALWLVLLASFAFTIIKRRLDYNLFAIGAAGVAYFIAGVFFDILGDRGWQLAIVPLIQGIFPLLKFYKRETIAFLLILLAVFPLAIAHNYFDSLLYQTKDEEFAGDFLSGEVDSIPDYIAVDKGFSVFGKDTVLNYFTGRLDLSRVKYCWAYTTANPRSTTIIWSRNNDFVFLSERSDKAMQARLKYDSERLAQLHRLYETNYNRLYDNGETQIYAGE